MVTYTFDAYRRHIVEGKKLDNHGGLAPLLEDGTNANIAFAGRSCAELEKRFSGEEKGYYYAGCGHSGGNPDNHKYVEAMVALEGGRTDTHMGLSFASGMAALHTLFMSFPHSSEILYPSTLYGKTIKLLNKFLPERTHIRTKCVENSLDLSAWGKAFTRKTRLVILETPTNPTLTVYPIDMFAALAHKYGAFLLVDNTVPTGALQKPLEHGADFALTSVSKGFSCGQALGGVLVGGKDIMEPVRELWEDTRPIMDARVAVHMHEGLQTLHSRMHKHSENALKFVRFLRDELEIKAINYPFYEGFHGFVVAKAQMVGGGPLLSFEIPGGREEAFRFIDSLKTVPVSPHITANQTIILHPASTIYAKLTPERRALAGIGEGLVRMSIGREDPDLFNYILKDFAEAFHNVFRKK